MNGKLCSSLVIYLLALRPTTAENVLNSSGNIYQGVHTVQEGFQLWHRYCHQSHTKPEDHCLPRHVYDPSEAPVAIVKASRARDGTVSAPRFTLPPNRLPSSPSRSSQSSPVSPHVTSMVPLSPCPVQPVASHSDLFSSTFSAASSAASSSISSDRIFYVLKTVTEGMVFSSM